MVSRGLIFTGSDKKTATTKMVTVFFMIVKNQELTLFFL
jgi:hypothetical protein